MQPAWLGLLSWIVGRDANTLSPGVAFAAGGALVAGIAAGFLLAFPARVGADHQWGLLRIGGSVLPLAAVLATFAATLVVHAGIGAPRVLMASLVAMAFAVGLVTGRVLGHDLKARRTEHVDLMAPGKTGRFLSRL